MRIRSIVLLAIAAASLAPVGAFAEDVACTAAGGNGANPQFNDPTGDWEGVVFGNQSALIPYGDVHREGTDLVAAWVSIDGSGKYYANISSALLDGTQVNTTFSLRWEQDAGLPAQARRFVHAQISERGTATYEHGYLAVDPQTGIDNINTLGTTRGTMTNGTPGVISIEIPFGIGNRIPKPTTLNLVVAETRVLLGARGNGLLGLADATDDGDGPCFDITL